jgi:hypothetical protein
VIRDVAELRERGQVYRRVDELDIDVDTWRAGMRRSARREGMRIRTFVVEQTDDERDDDSSPRSDLVFAVRTDLPPPDPAELAAIVNSLPPPPGYGPAAASSGLASVTSLTDEHARRSGHPCADDTR